MTAPTMAGMSSTTTINGHRPNLAAMQDAQPPNKRPATKPPAWDERLSSWFRSLDSESYLGGVYYAMLVACALYGGAEAMVALWGVSVPQAVFFTFVAELGGVYLMHMAASRMRKGERPYIILGLSTVVAAGAFALQYAGHMALSEVFQAYFFAGASALGYTSYTLRSLAKRRDALRSDSQLAKPTPVYGLEQWLSHPIITLTARAIAKNSDEPMTRAESIDAAEIQRGLMRWIKDVIEQHSGGKGKDAKQAKRRARAMLTVHPARIVAVELSRVADRDAHVRWLASLLDPRVMTGTRAAPAPPPPPSAPEVVAALERVERASGRVTSKAAAAAKASAKGRSPQETWEMVLEVAQRNPGRDPEKETAWFADQVGISDSRLRAVKRELRGDGAMP